MSHRVIEIRKHSTPAERDAQIGAKIRQLLGDADGARFVEALDDPTKSAALVKAIKPVLGGAAAKPAAGAQEQAAGSNHIGETSMSVRRIQASTQQLPPLTPGAEVMERSLRCLFPNDPRQLRLVANERFAFHAAEEARRARAAAGGGSR